MLKYLQPGSAILDLGCGSGRDTAFFRANGFDVVPVDGSKEICLLAGEFLKTPVLCKTFDQLDYTEEFDAVWACASLLHVSKAELPAIMQSVHKSLRIGGMLYASFKYGDDEIVRDGRRFSNYTEHSIRQIITDELWNNKENWISADVRPGRETERWINVIAQKR